MAAARCATAAWHGLESSSAWARSGGGGRERRVGASAKQEVAGLALHGGVGAEQLRRGAEQASRQEEGEKGPICNFQKFQGSIYKTRITFNLGLK